MAITKTTNFILTDNNQSFFNRTKNLFSKKKRHYFYQVKNVPLFVHGLNIISSLACTFVRCFWLNYIHRLNVKLLWSRLVVAIGRCQCESSYLKYVHRMVFFLSEFLMCFSFAHITNVKPNQLVHYLLVVN